MSLIEKIFSSGIVGDYFLNGSDDTLGLVLFIISVAVVIIAAYLLGSINFAIIISGKKYKQDIRDHGSKNAGMTNMMRTYGKKAAGLTLLGDALKAVAACLVGYVLIGSLGAYIAGLFCILGHIFPIFYKFKGGKGIAATAGLIIAFDWRFFVVCAVVFFSTFFITHYVSLGSLLVYLAFVIEMVVLGQLGMLSVTEPAHLYEMYGISLFLAVMAYVKHIPNIKRLIKGEESKTFLSKKKEEA